MVIEVQELVIFQFAGTLIDYETIGEFDRHYPSQDPRCYAQLKPVIFGYITGGTLIQYCAEGPDDLEALIGIMNDTLPRLSTPFYALNCHFERGVSFNSCKFVPDPLLDVRANRFFGPKWTIREELGIPRHSDPFDGNGEKCMREWEMGHYSDCLKHNRACLLIERDIQTHARSIVTK
jgi:hypothetical protein